MAITVGNTSNGTAASNQITVSHTVVGSLLMVTVASAAGSTITSITYGGVSMSLVEETTPSGGRLSTYSLIDPPKGANNIVVNLSLSTSILLTGVDFSGVNTDTGLTFDAVVEGNGVTTSRTLNPASNTALVPDMIYAASGLFGTAQNQTPLNSQTEIADIIQAATSLVTGYKTAVDGNITPIGWSFEVSNNAAHAFAIRAKGVVVLPISADTMLLSSSPTNNFSTNDTIRIGESNAATGAIYRSIVIPNYSPIPAGKTLVESVLTMTPTANNSSNARTMYGHRVLRNVNISQATWNIFSTGNNWGTGGCSNSTTDYEGAVVIGSQTQPASPTLDAGGSFVMPLLASEIQKFVDGDYANNGLVLFVDTQLNDLIQYASIENATPAYRPRVVVRYAMPAEGGLFAWW